MVKTNHLSRIRIISLCLLVFALLLIGRLYFLQVVNHDIYIDKADRQYSSTSKNIFNRGTIFFTNKDGSLVSAATLQSGVIVAINPQLLENPEDVYQKLNPILPIDHDQFLAKAGKPNDPYEELATRVSSDVGDKITALKIKGLQVFKDRWRFYPGGSSGAHVLGLLGYKGDEYAGRYGLERQYEKQLERKDGAYVNFFAQIFSDIKSSAEGQESEADIVTTIEPAVETRLEALLKSTNDKWSSQLTGGIVMNPTNGEIIAMETVPTYNPNTPSAEKNSLVFSNPLIENVYEMGSIIKPLTVSAGIDAGVITASTTYFDTGTITINGKKISNFDGKGRGKVDMQEVISQSLNTGVAFVEHQLGDKKFTQYMYDFGLNEKTGIDLPNEGRNLVDNLKSPRELEHATASFGQGIALTPIATARALATIPSGGLLVSPHLVKSINYKLGYSKEVPETPERRVLKKSSADEITRLMVHSIDMVYASGKLKIPNYSVAAKTGTAQISKDGGGYYEDRNLHSFVGFFPAYNPKFFIFLYTYNPKGVQFSSETLLAPFMEMTKFLINYYEIPPDR